MACPIPPASDYDGDCISDTCDNCFSTCNSDQIDLNDDGTGDRCQLPFCPTQKTCKNGCVATGNCQVEVTQMSECRVGNDWVDCNNGEIIIVNVCECAPPSPPPGGPGGGGGPVEPLNCGDHVYFECVAP